MKILKILSLLCLLVGSNWLYGQTINNCVEATIRVVGDPSLTLCLGDGEDDVIRFLSSPQATPFAYLVVDENDLIVHIGLSNNINFEDLPEGELRVFSASFIGQLLGEVGDNYLETDYGTICSRLSENFITISNSTPNGGQVTTTDGAEEIVLCIEQGVTNVVDFASNSDFEPYLFVITNEENFILGTSPDGTVDFTGAPAGICRVWGLAYLGNYIGEVGSNLLFSDLSDACFDLSDNYVNIIRLSPESGSISYADGSNSFTSCSVTAPTGSLSIASADNNTATASTFVAVDNETGLVGFLFTDATFDLASQPDGSYTIYSVAYTGELNVVVGAPFNADNLSNECADLSNGISFTKRVINADNINLADGTNQVTICVGDGIADPLSFTNTYQGDDNYVYLITDESNFLLGTSSDATIDFEGAGAGICRVWGLAYSGNLSVSAGQNIGEPTLLSDECFDLSDGFVLVNRDGPEGGAILFADGTDSFLSCTTLTPSGTITAVVSGNDTGASYAFLAVNNETNIITVISTDGNIDLADLPNGNFSLYGLSYAGTLTATVGDLFDATSTGGSCFDLSDNSLQITRRVINAGSVSSADGSSSVDLCLTQDINSIADLTTTYSGDDSFIYVITDTNNQVLGTSESSTISFLTAEAGICRVWGLAYSGNLTIAAGDNLNANEPLSSECFDLSDDFVTINRFNPMAGTISYADGTDSFVSCSTLGPDGTVMVTVTGNDDQSDYSFVLVNDATNIMAVVTTTGTIDLSNLAAGTYTVYGVASVGDIGLMAGEIFNISAIEDATCSRVSGNSLSLINRILNADDVSLADGSDNITLCVGDGLADELTFASTYTGGDNFVYIITNEGNFVLGTSETGVIDFEGAGTGICRVWGLAYSGNLSIVEGDNLGGGQNLSDECFDLSDGFVIVNRNGAVGGTIAFADGSDSFLSCSPLDTNPVPTVSVTGNEPGADYAFLLVNDASGIIEDILDGGLLTTTSLANGNYTIYGVSFVGNLGYSAGDLFDTANPGSCADLADNSLSITREVQHADDVFLEDGSSEITICVGDGAADELNFISTYAGDDNFVYVITTEGNFVLATSLIGTVDFESAGPGVCRVWGLAYTGNLTLEEGDNIGDNIALSDACFDLTDNYVTVNRNGPDGGTLAFTDGTTSFEDCSAENGGSTLDMVATTTAPGIAYAYLVVDPATDAIVAILNDPSLDLMSLPLGTYNVHGVSYLENLTANVGDVFTGAQLADVCFDLSDNNLTVVNRSVIINEIAFEDGTTTAAICPDDAQVDILNFTTDYTGTDNIAYLITDIDNTVIEILAGASTNFSDYEGDFVRVWAVAFSGNFFLQTGTTLTPTTPISDDCYDITENFLLVDLRGPDGGSLAFAGMESPALVCTNDGQADLLTIETTAPAGANYVYLITDEDNMILNTTTSSTIDFENVPAGICRIWGVAYLGNLVAEVGGNTGDQLASECADLSDNFLVVIRTEVDGATVSLEDGSTMAFSCSGDGDPDLFTFVNTSTSIEEYTYVITDDQNTILAVLDGNSVDLDLAAPGNCRAWGLSYTGNITVETGISAVGAVFTDECYALSNNFVSIQRDQVIGGDVSLSDGNTSINICGGDNVADVLNFMNTGSSTGAYTYVITDVNNNILSSFSTGSLDFDALIAPTEIRVWGVAFTGLPTINSGDIQEQTLSNLCFDLSSNFVTVIREQPNGGSVVTSEGQSTLYLCTDDGLDDIYSFVANGASNTDYAFLITDENNAILDILTNTNMANFEGAPNGTCRVWGLAYTGTLLAEAGQDAASTTLSNDCFSLSSDFVTVVRGELNAGTVSGVTGTGDLFTCPNDGNADLLTFDSLNVGSGVFNYVLTDENNIIIEFLTSDELDFEDFAEGTYRLWGLVTTGDILATIGDDAAATTLAAGCFDLSDNFITIVNVAPVAGDLLTADGQESVQICIGDGQPDPFTVIVEGASEAAYTYLVVDADSILVGTLNDPTFDFDNAAPGDWYIYGLSYTGVISILPGAHIFEETLVSGCSDLSTSVIFVDKTQVDGGNIFTDNGDEVVYTCPDGTADIVNFINSGTSTEADYAYVLTTQGNIVLSVLTGNSIDFEEAVGLDALRIWGVSYTGNLLLSIGNDLLAVDASDACNVLSDNFINVFLDQPEGGMLSFDDGTDSLRLCYSNFMPGVHVNTSSTANVGYAYLLTDLDNVVIEVSEPADGVVSFDNVMPGFYHVWGVSYTGELQVAPGDAAAAVDLSNSCFELSSNFLTIERTEALDAAQVGTMSGEETIFVCPGDGVPDIVIFTNNSIDLNYRYIITDEDNRILFGDIESDLINFDIAAIGVCRVYGVSYTGDFTPLFMADATTTQLSTDCWALSDNYITIVRQLPEGGTVSTIDGETSIDITVGDGLADEVSFANTGIELTPYVYVVTDEQNVILGVSTTGTVNCEGAGEGTCRVWGLSYTGNITATVGDDADDVLLTDDCYDLSDNFVTVNRTADGNIQPETPSLFAGDELITLNLYPNPAVDVLQVNVVVPTSLLTEQQSVQVFNLNGMLLLEQPLSPTAEGVESIDVSQLQVGMYLLRWFDGEQVILTRFIKQ